ncbi:MAG TPA: DUF4349 domain-containing protein [Actinocrinis sp.]|uniref:DUF4349 domain-containing protein n=1 Tax=Actinocrinis sp. TaxID=1920516 RepID=UPI002D384E1E|nr:DUF4349 domain-containing protein [Actinocrinis sp.]HZU54742.1 DUF4349 domain-containing protein [Actinocrinis sp.]
MRGGKRRAGSAAAVLALVIAGPLALTACSGGNSGTSASSSARGPAAGQAQAPESLKQDSAGGTSSGSSSGSGSSASGTGTAVKLPSRDLVITVGLQVKTSDAAAAAAKAQSIAQAAGGYVANESIGSGQQVVTPEPAQSSGSVDGGTTPAPATLPDINDASDSTQAVLVLRVPPQSVDSVLNALTGKGTVTYQSRTATDVTGQVADVASRVASAQAAIAELRALIDKAASMNDLISLEQALAQRESDLEGLEAQQKALADQVQFATITVGYFTQGKPAAPPPVRTGFMRGLTVGWHGFLAVVRGLLVTLGWLVPYAVVVAVLWWPVRRLVRWSRGRRSGGARPTGTVALAPAGPPAAEGSDSSADD